MNKKDSGRKLRLVPSLYELEAPDLGNDEERDLKALSFNLQTDVATINTAIKESQALVDAIGASLFNILNNTTFLQHIGLSEEEIKHSQKRICAYMQARNIRGLS